MIVIIITVAIISFHDQHFLADGKAMDAMVVIMIMMMDWWLVML